VGVGRDVEEKPRMGPLGHIGPIRLVPTRSRVS
jgi:hypothetical protein